MTSESQRLPFLLPIALIVVSIALWQLAPLDVAWTPWSCLMAMLVFGYYALAVARFPGFFSWFALSYSSLFLLWPVVTGVFHASLPADAETYVNYCSLAVIGSQLFILGYELASDSGPQRRHWFRVYHVSHTRLATAVYLLFLANAFALALRVVEAGSFSALATSTRVDSKLSAGPLAQLATYCFAVGTVLYPLLPVYLKQNRMRVFGWLPLIAVVEIATFLALRTRTLIIVHSVAFLVGYYLVERRVTFSGHQVKKRTLGLSYTERGALVLFAVALVAMGFVLRTFRGQYERARSLTDIQVSVAASARYAFQSGAVNYAPVTCDALAVVPRCHDYLHGQSYYRLLFVPVPRAVWPNKPENTQRVMAQLLNPNAVEVQTSPVGIIGDLYVNFGFYGILGMLVFGYCFGLLDQRTGLNNILLMSVSFGMVFHLARGGFTNPILNLLVYGVVCKTVASFISTVPAQMRNTALRQRLRSRPPARMSAPSCTSNQSV